MHRNRKYFHFNNAHDCTYMLLIGYRYFNVEYMRKSSGSHINRCKKDNKSPTFLEHLSYTFLEQLSNTVLNISKLKN